MVYQTLHDTQNGTSVSVCVRTPSVGQWIYESFLYKLGLHAGCPVLYERGRLSKSHFFTLVLGQETCGHDVAKLQHHTVIPW